MSGTFMDKSFSVHMSGNQQYRDNYDRIFGKKEEGPKPKPEPINSCNLHENCAVADAKAREAGRAWASHCTDECCSDCFGD